MASTRFLIEVPHEEEIVACARAVEVFLTSGSHFLSHADWGCSDGVHKSWMTVDAESREEALRLVPPAFRAQAKVVRLNAFTMQEIGQILGRHKA